MNNYNNIFLNIGCGSKWEKPGWTPLDKFHKNDNACRLDLLQDRLFDHFSPNSVDLIYSSHTLEHFSWPEVCRILQEIHIIMKPGGVLRFSLPDLDLIIRKFIECQKKNDFSWWKNNQLSGLPNDDSEVSEATASFWLLAALGINSTEEHFTLRKSGDQSVIQGQHFFAFNFAILKQLLIDAGFHSEDIRKKSHNDTEVREFKEMDTRPVCSFQLEAIKRGPLN